MRRTGQQRQSAETSILAGRAPDIELLRVLVADDEPTILEILNLALTEMGHTVTTACNGKSALEQALGIDFDLIITDLKMPQMGGLEFTRRLVELRPRMSDRIILITGDVSELTAALKKTPDALHILPKPFGMAELTHAIESWWAKRQPEAGEQRTAAGFSDPAERLGSS